MSTSIAPASSSNTGEAKDDNDGSMKISEISCNGVTACAKLDCSSRFMEPQDGYIKSESRCKFAKCTVISSQEVYNDDDIRSVYTDKAPFNERLCLAMVLGIAAGVALAFVITTCPGKGLLDAADSCDDSEKKPPYQLYGLILLLIGLIAAVPFWLQCCRPTLNVTVFTTRLGWFPFSWGTTMEELKVRGHGPGINIQDADDVGHKILNRNQAEQILSEHAGKDIPKEGLSQKLIITNRRVGFKRRKACCCKLVTLENSLWTYKLDEVANCHADASFPLFFIIWCVWLALTVVVFFLWFDSQHPCLCDQPEWKGESNCPTKPTYCGDKDYFKVMDPDMATTFYVFAGILALYSILVPRLPGGIGCCRKSRIVVYFKSPTPQCCCFMTDVDEMELPPGSGNNKAVEICSEIMRAKADYIREKTA